MKKTAVDAITDKIKKGDVKMRSHFSVIAEKMGTGGAGILFVLLIVLISGFILYWTMYNGDLLSGGYGVYGVLSFFQSFPYLAGILFVLFLGVLAFVLRRYDFSYKKPFALVFGLVVLAAVASGYALTRQPAGNRFYQRQGGYYRMGMTDNANTVSGIVVSVGRDSFSVRDLGGRTVEVRISAATHFPFGRPKASDPVRVVGVWTGDSFEAQGVRVFGSDGQTTPAPGRMPGGGRLRMMRTK